MGVIYYLVAGPGLRSPVKQDYALLLQLFGVSDYVITPIFIGGPACSLYGVTKTSLGITVKHPSFLGFTDTARFFNQITLEGRNR